MDGLAIVSFISASLFLMLGLFVLTEGLKRRKAFIWLGLFFLVLAYNFLDGALLFSNFYLSNSSLILWEDPFLLLHGPSIFFFAHAIRTNRTWKPTFTLHFVPFIVAFSAVMYFHISSTHEERITLLGNISSIELSVQTLLGFIPVFIYLLAYVLVSRKILFQAQKELKLYYSTVEINWALDAVNLLLVLVLLAVFSTVSRIFPLPWLQILTLALVVISSIVLIARLLTKGLRTPIFLPPVHTTKSNLIDEEATSALFERIELLLREKELFKNPALTLKDLSDHLLESDRAVSFAINRLAGTHFYDYINRFRIESAKQLLSSPPDPNMTILEIMYQVGFNSKSSFNTQFKKITGLSPSSYKKNRR